MIMDTQEQFSSAQTLIVGTGDTVSTNILDTGAAHDEGVGEEVMINVRIGTAALSATGTLQVVLQTATDAAFTTPVEFPLTGALLQASTTANKFIYQGRLPIGLLRYLRIVYRVGTAAFTAGTADAFLTKDTQVNKPYAAGYTVS